MRTTSGSARAGGVDRLGAVGASPTTSMSGSASRIMPEAGAHQRLVVGDQDAHGHAGAAS